MLTEEALILIATLAASGMLALGVMELVWPTAPRSPVRRTREPLPPVSSAFAPGDRGNARAAASGDIVRARLASALLPAAPREVPEVSIRVVDQDADRSGEAVRAPDDGASENTGPDEASERFALASESDTGATAVGMVDTVDADTPAAAPGEQRDRPSGKLDAAEIEASGAATVVAEPERDSFEALPAATPPVTPADVPLPVRSEAASTTGGVRRRPTPADRGRTVLPVETCQGMYNEHRYNEVVSLGSAALEVHARLAAVSHRPDEASALQDLVGLARQELGDRDGARAAFIAAIAAASAAARPTYVRHLLTLVRGVVDGVNVKDDDGVRVRELRACLAAINDALDTVPGDASLTAAHQAVVEAVGRICESLMPYALDDDGDPAAKALLIEVAADERMAGPWRDRLRERLAAGSSAEVGRLTVFAVRAVQEGREDDALDALGRAERLAAALTGSPDADERREELERRFWWGYTKVGLRRLEAGTFSEALDPLFRALRLGRVDADRRTETRAALVRAVDGVGETVLAAVQGLRERDPEAAAAETARVAEALHAWTAHGLTEQDLGEAHDRISRITQALA